MMLPRKTGSWSPILSWIMINKDLRLKLGAVNRDLYHNLKELALKIVNK